LTNFPLPIFLDAVFPLPFFSVAVFSLVVISHINFVFCRTFLPSHFFVADFFQLLNFPVAVSSVAVFLPRDAMH